MTNRMKRWAMQAVGRENLKLVDEPIPAPGPHQILIKVSAVALNFHDKLVIDMGLDYPGGSFTPGSDMVGTITAAGAYVRRFKLGDRVVSTYVPDWIDGNDFSSSRTAVRGTLGGAHPGVLAEYILLDEEWAVFAPKSVSDAQAASLPCAGLTAWFALVEKGSVKAGESILVHGTGGVALFGVQIALAHGAEVILTSGSDEKLAKAKRLGVKTGINRNNGDWVEAVMNATNGRGVDHILETVGGAHLGRSLEAAANSGRVSMIGVFGGADFSGGFAALARKHLTIEGIGVGHRRGLEDLIRAVDCCGIKPVIDHEYSLAELPLALDHLDRGAFGKIVLRASP